MEKEVTEVYTDEVRQEVAARFGTATERMELLGDAENFVYRYPCEGGAQRILRVTHTSHRTLDQIDGELHWLNYLADRGVPAARALRSPAGEMIEKVTAGATDGTGDPESFRGSPATLPRSCSTTGPEGWGDRMSM